jgi:hypothetical protein
MDGRRVDAEQYRELDDGRVLVLFTSRGRAKLSGLDLGKIGGTGSQIGGFGTAVSG